MVLIAYSYNSMVGSGMVIVGIIIASQILHRGDIAIAGI
jgi:hypothetical protein